MNSGAIGNTITSMYSYSADVSSTAAQKTTHSTSQDNLLFSNDHDNFDMFDITT